MRWFSLLLLCAVGFPIAVRAATCEHPTSPSPEQNASAFLAQRIVLINQDDIYPLCGTPKIVTRGQSIPDKYTFDEAGRPLLIEKNIGTKLSYSKTVLSYDHTGKLAEVRTLNHDGDITDRELVKWAGPLQASVHIVFKSGAVSKEPLSVYTLNLQARTLQWRLSTLHVTQYDANWNPVTRHSESKPPTHGDRYEFHRDAQGYLREYWYSSPEEALRPGYRYTYSGSDSHGNPTLITEEVAALQYGTVNYKPYGNTRREITYW